MSLHGIIKASREEGLELQILLNGIDPDRIEISWQMFSNSNRFNMRKCIFYFDTPISSLCDVTKGRPLPEPGVIPTFWSDLFIFWSMSKHVEGIKTYLIQQEVALCSGIYIWFTAGRCINGAKSCFLSRSRSFLDNLQSYAKLCLAQNIIDSPKW